MAGHTPWEVIRARKGPETPEQAAMGAAFDRAMEEAERIAREQEAGATHIEAAATARRDDLYLAALRGYAEELGGRLVLTAVFPAPPAPGRRADHRQHAPPPAATPRRG